MKFHFLILFLFFTPVLFSQEAYFQQHVDYKIDVKLNDQEHTISGDIEIAYTNNAPNGLDSIFFHFWGNAFQHTNTAFAKQKLRNNSTQFYFSSDDAKGYYSNLNFMVDGQNATLQFDHQNPDIAILLLPKRLMPGETILIRSPFTLKIPASFSRLGHVGTSYQMTQWYPKPAVYDHKGWHPMPYLDIGEFYSEFGNFEVSISLPENYVVGASGVLQNDAEIKFLQEKVTATQALIEKGFPSSEAFPPSSEQFKTITYIAENVHDFAWFADKRFHVLKSEATLESGKKVDTWAMFTNKEADIWTKGADYVTRSVEFYSEMIGEYPWPQATAVHSALSAGGGMEYPMITVIGNSGNAKALDDVITHEVGHNWFYGILASNEREYAWMDEGMNSYYEYRYMRKYYDSRVDLDIPGFVMNHTHEDLFELGYLYNARRNLDQPCATHSNDFDMINYGLSAYVKPGTVLGHLEHYLGTSSFDRIMQLYYETWKFKHPYPEDFRALFEKESGKNLDWFFDGFIQTNNKLDYALKGISQKDDNYLVTVSNVGEINAPFPLSGMKNGAIIHTVWYEGFPDKKEINFPVGDYDQLILDATYYTIDVNRRNNNIKTSGPLKTVEPLQIGLLSAIENSRKNTLNLFPAVGYNTYDGPMIGLAFHNGLLPAKKLEYQLAPVYGTGSSDLVGIGNIQYNIFPKADKVKKITIGLSAKSFNFRSIDSLRTETGFESTDLKYRRLVPSIKIELRRSPTSAFYQTIQFRSILGSEEQTVFESLDTTGTFYTGNTNDDIIINELSWEIGNKRTINPFSLKLTLEQSTFEDLFNPAENVSYIRANLEWKSAYVYDRDRRFDFRFFIGGFLQNDQKDRGFISRGAYNLSGQGFNDYRWDELYFGRTETSGLLSRQVSQREGGLKAPLGSPYAEGRSNSFIFAINLKSDLPQNLPLNLPIKPYFDLGYYKDNRPISTNDPNFEKSKQLWYQLGFSLETLNGAIALHMPAASSKHLKDLLNQSGQDTFFKRISFTLDLFKLNPWQIAENLQL